MQTEYNAVKSGLSELYTNIQFQTRLKNEYREKAESLKKIEADLELELDRLRKARAVLQKITDLRNDQIKESINSLINTALSAVLQDSRYELMITDDNRGERNKETRIELVEKETGRIRSPKRNNGTAVKQIISFLFIVSLIEYSESSKIVFLDEKLNGLHPNLTIFMSGIITSLAKNNGFQFIIINHESLLFSDEGFITYNLHLPSISEGLKIEEVIGDNSIETVTS